MLDTLNTCSLTHAFCIVVNIAQSLNAIQMMLLLLIKKTYATKIQYVTNYLFNCIFFHFCGFFEIKVIAEKYDFFLMNS